MTTDYISYEEANKLLGLNDHQDEVAVASAISAASRRIDTICGRYFYQDAAVSTRKFRPTSYYDVWVDDISTTTGLIVASDVDDDGTAETTLTVDIDFVLEPANGIVDGIAGWPYTKLCATTSRTFPMWNRGNAIHVTAKFGWAAVPEPVRQACGILTSWLYKMKDAPLGVAGYGDFGAIRVRENPVVEMMLQPYIKHAVMVA